MYVSLVLIARPNLLSYYNDKKKKKKTVCGCVVFFVLTYVYLHCILYIWVSGTRFGNVQYIISLGIHKKFEVYTLG